jgi:hypothetical protein
VRDIQAERNRLAAVWLCRILERTTDGRKRWTEVTP